MNNQNSINPVFIITTGRSGSTLLQRYLNSSNNLIIWGEHGGFIGEVSNSYYKFIELESVQRLLEWGRRNANLLLEQSNTIDADIEWTNNFTLNDWKIAHRDLLVRLFTIDIPTSMRWGFKEIRYGEKEIRLLKDLFPDAQFIFLVRNPIDTLASMIAAWYRTENILEHENWRTGEFGPDLQEFVFQHCTRTIKIVNGIIKYMNEGFIINYENLKGNPFDVVDATFKYLNLTSPPKEKIESIASKIRNASNAETIKIYLYNKFFYHEKVQELCLLYKSFGYSCALPGQNRKIDFPSRQH